jgi:hypothetical protein
MGELFTPFRGQKEPWPLLKSKKDKINKLYYKIVVPFRPLAKLLTFQNGFTLSFIGKLKI